MNLYNDSKTNSTSKTKVVPICEQTLDNHDSKSISNLNKFNSNSGKSPMMEPYSDLSTSSISSIGFPEPSDSQESQPVKKVFLEQVLSLNKTDLSDVYCVAVICKEHKKIALKCISNKCYYLPFTHLCEGYSFSTYFRTLLRQVIFDPNGQVTLPSLVDMWRVEYPKKGQFLTRYTFRTVVECAKSGCCVNSGVVCWHSSAEMMKILTPQPIDNFHSSLWGAECSDLLTQTLNSTPTINVLREVAAKDSLEFATDKSTVEGYLLYILGYDQDDLSSLLNEFIEHCFPSERMTFVTFCKFFATLMPATFRTAFTFDKMQMMFNAFTKDSSHTLSFRDLMFGLALMDESSSKLTARQANAICGQIQHIRLGYIFRYYDLNQDDLLSRTELKLLLDDYMNNSVNRHCIPNLRTTQVDCVDSLLAMFAVTVEQQLSLKQLPLAMQHFEETLHQQQQQQSHNVSNWESVLFKLPFDVRIQAANKFAYKKRLIKRSQHLTFCNQEQYLNTCQMCRNVKYLLSDQLINLSRNGEIGNIIRLEPLSPDGQMSFGVDIPESEIFLLANDIILRLHHFGDVLFYQHSVATDEEMVSRWFFGTNEEMFQAIRTIINAATVIFSRERRVVEVQSPCYVFGDLHGNLKDLISFSHHFWRSSPFVNNGKYLFLGDYVDRGQWGIEVVVFLFALKILAPNNFFMIRGNHEIRSVQEQFSFYTECTSRLSIEMWRLINDCFDSLPIAAIIDERLFGSHGGIPASVTTIEQLLNVPCPIVNPMQQSPETWEILWNDPINVSELSYLPDLERSFMQISRGFARNIKRGTAYLYTQEAVVNFCTRNTIDFILRAHEVFPEGIYFYQRGDVISIFSSSHYATMNNSASCLLVKQNRIRVIRIENVD